jgi:hypothetical protein
MREYRGKISIQLTAEHNTDRAITRNCENICLAMDELIKFALDVADEDTNRIKAARITGEDGDFHWEFSTAEYPILVAADMFKDECVERAKMRRTKVIPPTMSELRALVVEAERTAGLRDCGCARSAYERVLRAIDGNTRPLDIAGHPEEYGGEQL